MEKNQNPQPLTLHLSPKTQSRSKHLSSGFQNHWNERFQAALTHNNVALAAPETLQQPGRRSLHSGLEPQGRGGKQRARLVSCKASAAARSRSLVSAARAKPEAGARRAGGEAEEREALSGRCKLCFYRWQRKQLNVRVSLCKMLLINSSARILSASITEENNPQNKRNIFICSVKLWRETFEKLLTELKLL